MKLSSFFIECVSPKEVQIRCSMLFSVFITNDKETVVFIYSDLIQFAVFSCETQLLPYS